MPSNKKVYHARKREHLCVQCGIKLRKTYKKVHCPACLENLKKRQNTIDPEQRNYNRREWYAHRRDVLKICPRCGSKPAKGKTLCKTCLSLANGGAKTKKSNGHR
ncbi:MAG: hypothetical protein Ta2B_25820 [Termitinemataceae bacterium]|nr:MAG: hypothetical protein Ta2B_25820 [Termitinemataceae bacterium]